MGKSKEEERREWDALLAERMEEVEEIITQYLPKARGQQKTVIEAMDYSVLAGGKRMRPMIMQLAFFMCGGVAWIVEPFMVAIELIHTYSLVHDDLPSMDNDTYRRGKETTHVVYGEGMAVLAGDGLLNHAYETACMAFSSSVVDGIGMVDRYKMAARSITILAKKAGINGMIAGQTADMEAEKKEQITDEELLFIHEKKTAALIEASLMIGGALAGADKETIDILEKCGHSLGIAFQIQDDILDVIGTKEELGKNTGSDEKNNKKTYVTCYGLEAAEKEAARRYEEALGILEEHFGEDSDLLREYIDRLIYRKN